MLAVIPTSMGIIVGSSSIPLPAKVLGNFHPLVNFDRNHCFCSGGTRGRGWRGRKKSLKPPFLDNRLKKKDKLCIIHMQPEKKLQERINQRGKGDSDIQGRDFKADLGFFLQVLIAIGTAQTHSERQFPALDVLKSKPLRQNECRRENRRVKEN